jgi:hypothetical protein
VRRQLEPFVASGAAVCARCGEAISPWEEWHLDHNDDRTGYIGPSHAKCNLSAAGKRSRPPAPAGRVDLAEYVDDPGRGVFWGPPSGSTGVPIRWSRVWFEWRSEPYYAHMFEQ